MFFLVRVVFGQFRGQCPADDPKAIVINQGGDTIKVGQVFKALKLEEELKDLYTKETLGRAEQEVANLKVTRVYPKLSYGKIQSCSIVAGEAVLLKRLRNVDQAKAGSDTATNSTSTPFD